MSDIRSTPAWAALRQQILDKDPHPGSLLFNAAHCLGGLLGITSGPCTQQLRVATDRRQRRAQLVRRVGKESAQTLLYCLALGKRPLQPTKHSV